MSKTKDFISNHKKLLIILAVVLVLAIAIVAVLLSRDTADVAADAFAAANQQTEVLAKTDIEQIVSGTGKIQSRSPREVTSSSNYEVKEIYVAEGDWVEEGQLLATLDSEDLDKEIADLREDIADAEEKDADSVADAEEKLADAIETRDENAEKNEESIQEALDSIEQARKDAGEAALEEGAVEYATEASADAKNTLTSAQTALQTAQASYSAKEVTYQTLLGYEKLYYDKVLDSSKEDLLETFGYESIEALSDAVEQAKEDRDALQPNVDAAQAAYDSAEAKYDATYEAAYQLYKSSHPLVYSEGYNDADVSNLESTYEKAVETKESTYETDTKSIESAQKSLDSQKEVDSAEAYRSQLETLLENKEDCRIVAPSAGTVTEMSAEVGKTSTGMAMFTIENTNELEISVSIPEYDVPNISIGTPVTITSDAYDNKEWTGTVSVISPKATDDSGNFTVTVDITSEAEGLAIGMSAKVNIIVDSQTDIFAVPYDAVTENEQGQKIIYVVEENTSGDNSSKGKDNEQASLTRREIVVETGMEGDYYIEISGAGLKEGLTYLSDPEGKNVSTAAPSFGPF